MSTDETTSPDTDEGGTERRTSDRRDKGRRQGQASGPIADDRRTGKERRQNIERRSGQERRQGGERRRQIDPTTCERDYSEEEIIFMKAMDQYKRDNRRPFPTWSEVLEVLRALGYRKIAEPTAMPGLKPTSTRREE